MGDGTSLVVVVVLVTCSAENGSSPHEPSGPLPMFMGRVTTPALPNTFPLSELLAPVSVMKAPPLPPIDENEPPAPKVSLPEVPPPAIRPDVAAHATTSKATAVHAAITQPHFTLFMRRLLRRAQAKTDRSPPVI